MFIFKKQQRPVDMDKDDFTELAKKHGLEGKVDCRVDINGRAAKQGEVVATFITILEPGQGPTRPPQAFIDEALPILRKRYNAKHMRLEVHPSGMTLAEIHTDQAAWSAHCRDYYGD